MLGIQQYDWVRQATVILATPDCVASISSLAAGMQ